MIAWAGYGGRCPPQARSFLAIALPQREGGFRLVEITWVVPNARVPAGSSRRSDDSSRRRASADGVHVETAEIVRNSDWQFLFAVLIFFQLRKWKHGLFTFWVALMERFIPVVQTISTIEFSGIRQALSCRLNRVFRLLSLLQITFYQKHKAFAFEKYLKSGSGRAFSKRHFQ